MSGHSLKIIVMNDIGYKTHKRHCYFRPLDDWVGLDMRFISGTHIINLSTFILFAPTLSNYSWA